MNIFRFYWFSGNREGELYMNAKLQSTFSNGLMFILVTDHRTKMMICAWVTINLVKAAIMSNRRYLTKF